MKIFSKSHLLMILNKESIPQTRKHDHCTMHIAQRCLDSQSKDRQTIRCGGGFLARHAIKRVWLCCSRLLSFAKAFWKLITIDKVAYSVKSITYTAFNIFKLWTKKCTGIWYIILITGIKITKNSSNSLLLCSSKPNYWALKKEFERR